MREDDRRGEHDEDCGSDHPSRAWVSGIPLDEAGHGDILQLLIGEGANAALETFFEAKDPNIDPLLKLKLIGLASNIGDNVRKAIATHATHFGAER